MSPAVPSWRSTSIPGCASREAAEELRKVEFAAG